VILNRIPFIINNSSANMSITFVLFCLAHYSALLAMIRCALQPILIQPFYSSLIIAVTHEFFILLIVAKQLIGLYLDEFFVSK
jgi:hypothetical protein